jgi:hypothetical protein
MLAHISVGGCPLGVADTSALAWIRPTPFPLTQRWTGGPLRSIEARLRAVREWIAA